MAVRLFVVQIVSGYFFGYFGGLFGYVGVFYCRNQSCPENGGTERFLLFLRRLVDL